MPPLNLPTPHNLRRAASLAVGWLADRRLPGPTRTAIYRGYSWAMKADPSEAQLPLSAYPSLGAFFVRRLKPGARPIDPAPDRSISPCDGLVQALDRIESGTLLQAKGRAYPVEELLAGAQEGLDLEGAWAVTLYLGPKDYHRVHTPLACELTEVRWVPGDRLSVSPKTVAARPKVLSINERAVLRLETEAGPMFLVMVGALNVGRIRVVGVEPGTTPAEPVRLERGDELARFEMGSTVVLIHPKGASEPLPETRLGETLRLGQALMSFESKAALDSDPGESISKGS